MGKGVCSEKCQGGDQTVRQLDGLPVWLNEQEGAVCLSDIHGWRIRLTNNLCIWPVIPSSCCISMMDTSRSSKDCYPLRRNKSSELCWRGKKGTPLPEESRNRQTATHQGCTTATCPDQSVRVMGTSVDDNSRGFQVVLGVDQMLLMQLWQKKSKLLTTL